MRFSLRELRTFPRREFRRVEVTSLHLENPDVFVTRFVRLGHRDERGVDHGQRTEIRKPVMVGMNGGRESGTKEVDVVREDDDVVDPRDVGRRADAGKLFLAILRDPFRLRG